MSGRAAGRHVEAFLEMASAERGAALNTLQAYRRDLDDYVAFLATRGVGPETAGAEDVRAHVADLAARGFKASSASRKLSAVRQFHKFLYSDAIRSDDPTAAIDSPRRGRALPKTLSTADIEALIAAAADPGPEPTPRARLSSARLVCLLEIAYSTGLRVSVTALFAGNGWYGSVLEPLGVKVAYAPLGIVVAMAFTSLPFVVRSVQPVLQDLTGDYEEAAETLGAGPWRIFRSVLFPEIFPAFLAGCSLAFARSLGEFGAVIFIAGNQPFRTEIAALLVFIRLEEYDYQAAAAIATVMLAAAFLMLLVTNAIQLWRLRYARPS
ncbi:site-specific integrase [Hansschlegelia beijingensis]